MYILKLVKTDAADRSVKALPCDLLFSVQLRAQTWITSTLQMMARPLADIALQQSEIPDLQANGFVAPTHSLPMVTPVTCLWAEMISDGRSDENLQCSIGGWWPQRYIWGNSGLPKSSYGKERSHVWIKFTIYMYIYMHAFDMPIQMLSSFVSVIYATFGLDHFMKSSHIHNMHSMLCSNTSVHIRTIYSTYMRL